MKRILCYGDSNTWGHNPQPDGACFRYEDEVRWTGLLQRILEGHVRIIEEGLCGRTVMFDDPVAPDRNGSKFLNCAIQSHQPLDLVIIMLGTNDVRHIFTPSVKEIALGMSNLVRMVRNTDAYGVGEVPKVLVVAPAAVRGEIKSSVFYGMYDEESVKKSRQLYDAYRDVLNGMDGVHVINAEGTAEVSLADCIHFSVQGHRQLAEAAAASVRSMLNI